MLPVSRPLIERFSESFIGLHKGAAAAARHSRHYAGTLQHLTSRSARSNLPPERLSYRKPTLKEDYSMRSLTVMCISAVAATINTLPAMASPALHPLDRLPMSFEPNVGQVSGAAPGAVSFVARGPGYTVFLGPDQAVMRLHSHAASVRRSFKDRRPRPRAEDVALVRMRMLGTAAAPAASGSEMLPGIVNYLKGHDARAWRTNVPTFAKVTLAQVYHGIDLVYYGHAGQFEYDFVVAPGADPRSIRLAFATEGDGRYGAPRVAANGDIVLAAGDGAVRLHKPVIYQADGETRHTVVDGHFRIAGNEVRFEVGPYDTSKPLVIDPVLVYSTFLGSPDNSDFDEGGPYMTADAQGNTYLTGDSDSLNYPVLNPFQGQRAGGYDSDAVITKLNPTGTALVYSTYLGGTGEDTGQSIAVDSGGNAYIGGYTCSSDFPVTQGAYQTTLTVPAGCNNFGNLDAFVTKLAPSGSSLVYSTYYGGSVTQAAAGIAVDKSGNAYFIGNTLSPDLPVTPGAVQPTYGGAGPNGFGDAFAAELNAAGSSLIYSTYLGGSGDDEAYAVAVDTKGNAYIGGFTASSNFPVTKGVVQPVYGGSSPDGYGDGFVAKLNPGATKLIYSTYLGGAADDGFYGLAIDKQDHAYVTGYTESANYPVTKNAYQVVYDGGPTGTGSDAIVTKLNKDATALSYSTYVGGDGDDFGVSLALGAKGLVWVTGGTLSPNFPTTPNAFQRFYGGTQDGYEGDAFLLSVAANGSKLGYATYIGGTGDDFGASLVAIKGGLYIGGATTSPNFPVTTGAYQTKCKQDGQCLGGAYDGFVLEFTP
jgi:hypothetical protein